jgi:hypothetical protein
MTGDRQAGAIARVEEILSEWERNGQETYRELAVRIVTCVLREMSDHVFDERDHLG